MSGPKKGRFKFSSWKFTLPSVSSLAEEQPGCLATHHPGQWSLQTTVCSTLRRYGWPAEGDGGWSWSSCCHGRHFLPIPKLRRLSTQARLRGKLVLRLRHARRSCPFAEACGSCLLGTEAQPWMNGSLPFPSLFLPFHVQTWLYVSWASSKIKNGLKSSTTLFIASVQKTDWPTFGVKKFNQSEAVSV